MPSFRRKDAGIVIWPPRSWRTTLVTRSSCSIASRPVKKLKLTEFLLQYIGRGATGGAAPAFASQRPAPVIDWGGGSIGRTSVGAAVSLQGLGETPMTLCQPHGLPAPA